MLWRQKSTYIFDVTILSITELRSFGNITRNSSSDTLFQEGPQQSVHRVRSHPVSHKTFRDVFHSRNSYQREFLLDTEILLWLNWHHCPVQPHLSEMCFTPSVQMANKLSNLIILILLVLITPNLRPGNSRLLPSSSVCLNMILIQVSICWVWLGFFAPLSSTKVYFKYSKREETIFNTISIFFPFTSQTDGKIRKTSLTSLLACLKWSSRPLHSQLSHQTALAFQ